MSSFLSVRVHAGVIAQELLQAVAERMDVPQGDLLLVAVTYPGGKYTHNSLHRSTTAAVIKISFEQLHTADLISPGCAQTPKDTL